MCGVVGYFGFGRPTPSRDFEAAVAALAHRGPDGAGRWSGGDVALGHRRLAVMDPAGGAQPVSGCTGRVHAVVNGEFYDFEAHRVALEAKGHRFRTRSDSEVLVHLYEDRGLAALTALRGEFAFVLYDEAERRLIAARDRFGIKPLVFARHDGALWVASEPGALFAAGVRPRWDEDALLFALRLQYVPEGATLFEGVSMVPPGALLVVDEVGPRVERYWRLAYPLEGEQAPMPDAPARIAEALEDAVRVRTRADVGVATLLSGGLDSSAVAGISAAQAGVERAFTVRFDEEAYDEGALASATAASLGLEHHVVHASPQALLDEYEASVLSAGGLLVNPHGAAKRLLSRAIREAGYKVVLSGEGADEIFAGYPHFRADLLPDGGGPRLMRANLVSRGLLLSDGPAPRWARLERELGFVPGLLATKAALGARLGGLLTREWGVRHTALDVERRLLTDELMGELRGRSRLAQAQIFAIKLSLGSYILPMFDDAQEMAFGVEARMPYLDHCLFEVARELPDAWKIHGEVEKHVLREAARPHLLPELVARRKHPFFAPPLVGVAQPEARARLLAWVHDGPDIFDRDKLAALLQSAEQGDIGTRVELEPLISIALGVSLLSQRFGL